MDYIETLSERSLKSLANLVRRDQQLQATKTMPNINNQVDYLSHSNTETLSGSSTTSIVNNKCYGKSWKQGMQYKESDYYESEHEDDLERGHETISTYNRE